MYKNIFHFTSLLFIIYLLGLSFLKYQILTESILSSSIIFLKNIFPFLLITIFINNLLTEFNLPHYFNKIFNNKYLYIFIMSILSGSPSNAIIISNLLDKRDINEKDASILLSFTTFNSPLFLYYYFHLIFHNTKLVILLFIFIYLPNIIMLIISFRYLSQKKMDLDFHKDHLFGIVSQSIQKSINSLLYIYGTIIVFRIICDLLLPSNSFLRGFIEITQGLNILSNMQYNIKIKELLTLIILSYAGLSIHIQISTVLKEYKINYCYFYLSRLVLILFDLLILFI